MTEAVPKRTRFRRSLNVTGEDTGEALVVGATLVDDDHDFDVELEIAHDGHRLRRIDVTYRNAPFGECFREGGVALKRLEGEQVGLDFKHRAREVLGGGQGCLHLRSLMTALGDYLSILLYANHLGVLEPDMDPKLRYERSYHVMGGRCPGFALGPEPDPERLVLPTEPVSTKDRNQR